jgi:hypothetical protein
VRNPEVGGFANSPGFRPINRLESVSVRITAPHAYFADQQLLTSPRNDVELSAREMHIHVEYSIAKLHEAFADTRLGKSSTLVHFAASTPERRASLRELSSCVGVPCSTESDR